MTGQTKVEPQSIKWFPLERETAPIKDVHFLVLLLIKEQNKTGSYVLLAETSFFYHPVEQKFILRGFLVREGPHESFSFLEINLDILAWAPITPYSTTYPRF